GRKSRTGRVNAKSAALASNWIKRQHPAGRSDVGKGEDAACAGVIVVVGLIGGNDQVIRVVAAIEEQADQRFVIGGGSGKCRSGGGVDHPQIPDGGDHGGGSHGRAGGSPNEFPSSGLNCFTPHDDSPL